jgi:hypothetical protein
LLSRKASEMGTRHSDATFSHGICPDCMKKLYPDHTKSGSKDPGDKERK